jgi:hypothetical protein
MWSWGTWAWGGCSWWQGLFVYYESIKWELKIRCMYECRCDERLQTKTKKFTCLVYPGLGPTVNNFFYFTVILFIYYESTKRKLKTKYMWVSVLWKTFYSCCLLQFFFFCLPLLWPNEFPSDRGGIHSVGRRRRCGVWLTPVHKLHLSEYTCLLSITWLNFICVRVLQTEAQAGNILAPDPPDTWGVGK